MMASKEILRADQFERRWPVVLQLLVVVGIATHPARIHIMPLWFGYLLAVALILPMVGVGISRGGLRWTHLEHWSNLAICALGETVVLLTLYHIITEMLKTPTAFTGEQLLATSIAAWTINVVTFSVVFWQIDRGGPEARANRLGKKAEWLFPQASGPDAEAAEWMPTSADYLFLSFCTATAFSPTDVAPVTTRAKMLMMVESAISLITLVIVASRAINILGS
jgi:hypothetical protein